MVPKMLLANSGAVLEFAGWWWCWRPWVSCRFVQVSDDSPVFLAYEPCDMGKSYAPSCLSGLR